MTSFSAVPRGRQGASDRREKIAFAFDNYLLSISFVRMFSPNRPPSLPIAALVLVLFGAPLHALPEVKFDKSKSLGSWRAFVTSLGLQKKPDAAIYFDTDRLVVGEFETKFPYSSDFEPEKRRQIRTGVGRLVKQVGGPDIVVYDFDEIYSAVGPSASIKLPSTIYLFGRRPAAIVADGQISNWPAEARLLTIYALNSCDPNDTSKSAQAGQGRGGDGGWRQYVRDDGQEIFAASGGGSGGYGTPGARGFDSDGRPHHFLPGGQGGAVSYSWDVIRPGSPGGGSYTLSDAGSVTYEAGGVGGGAVWIKSGGRLDLDWIFATGGNGLGASPAGGSGGHVVIESPEIPNVFMVQSSGGMYRAGAGVVEFRGTPGAPKVGGIIGGTANEVVRVPVALPGRLKLDEDVYGASGPLPKPVVFSRLRVPVPTVTGSAPRRFTNAQKFVVAAAATAANIPAAVRYRLRPPGSTFFSSWITELLPAGSTKNKSWEKEVTSRKQGRWQVEVVADDAKGGRSTGKVVDVLVDWIKPQCYSPINDAVEQTAEPGSYKVKVYADDYDSAGVGTNASGPARVEYRLKRPGATRFGNWRRVTVGAPDQHAEWPYVQLIIPVTLDPLVRGEWAMELRVVDLAGNISDADSITIEQ